MLHRPRRLVFTVAALCLLAACTPTSPTPTPSPAPSYRCTPEAGGDEFDCTQAQHDEMIAKDKLYAEAEAVYRRYLAEDMRIARSGGVREPTEELLDAASGAFLESAIAEYRRNLKEQITIEGGEREVKSLTRLVGLSKGGSIVAIRSCVDATSIRVLKSGKYVGRGLVTQDDLYFGLIDSHLKIIGADGRELESCGLA